MKNSIITFFIFHLALLGFSQDSLTYEISYDIHVNYPAISISKEELKEAQTLMDLNARYDSLWMKEYISVEILTSYKGTIQKALSKNETLSQEQKDHMAMADIGTDISVKVEYIPENNLIHNDMKEYKFTFTIHPSTEAAYIGGPQELKKYLKATAIDKMPENTLAQYQLAAVKFTVNEEGKIIDPHTFWTTKDEKIDALLLETISKMPDWKPAVYFNGVTAKQELVFTVGDMKSCVVNLINIREE